MSEDTARERVVLLHGLARSRFSMWTLERALRRAGYEPINIGYPSTRRTPEQLVDFLHQRLLSLLPEGDQGPVHFVTHSLGGVLLRAYLAAHPCEQLGRIVQLTPPNQGSEIVDRIGEWRLFGWIFGPTGRSLGTTPESLPNRVAAPPTEVGVIAGSRSLNPLGTALLPGAGDGAVTLERTRLEGGEETDWIAFPIDHTTIMLRPQVAEQVVHFLRHGHFRRAESEAEHTGSLSAE